MFSRLSFLNLLIIGVLVFSVLVSVTMAAPSLTVKKTWGGNKLDYYASVAVDSSGNIYAAGGTYSYGPGSPSYPALALVKYSPAGTLLWQRVWTNGSNLYTSYYSTSGVAVDLSGNVYVVGSVTVLCNNALSSTVFLVKFNSTGSLQWQEAVTSCNSISYAYLAIATGPSGEVYVVGTTYTYGAGMGDILLLKFSAAGAIQQEKTWGGSNGDYPTHLTVDSSGNVYIVGGTASFGTNAVLLKLDPALSSVLFQKMIGVSAPSGVGVDSSGNTYISSNVISAGHDDALVVKFDSTSGFQWAKTWGGTNGTDYSNSLAVDPSGNSFVTGWTTSYGEGGPCFGGNCDALFLAKISATGNLVSQFVYGGLNYTQASAVALDGSGNAAIVGTISGMLPSAAGSGNNTLGSFNPSISSVGNSTLGPASYTTHSLTGTVGTPTGSESYSGSTDSLFLEYGSPSSSAPVSPLSILIAALITTPMIVQYKRRRRLE